MSSYLSQIDTILTDLGDEATAEELATALRHYGKRDIQAVLAARASEGGGTFNGGTITEPLVVAPAQTDISVPVIIEPTGEPGPSALLVHGAPGVADGYRILEVQSDDDAVIFNVDGDGSTKVTLGVTGDGVFSVDDTFRRFEVTQYSLKFHHNAAINDLSLAAGECSLWFDATNGAAKLEIKAKQADGTLVFGEIALAP